MVEIGATMVVVAVELAAPVIVVSLLAQLALALVRRAAPSLVGRTGGGGNVEAHPLVATAAVLCCVGGLASALALLPRSIGELMVSTAERLAAP